MWKALHAAELDRARELLGDRLQAKDRSGAVEPESVSALLEGLKRMLRFAGVERKAFNHTALKLGAPLLVILLVLLPLKPLFAFVPLALYPITLYLWLKSKSFRRAESFERDYVAFLLSLASAIRSGQDPIVALTEARLLFPSPSVLGAVLEQLKLNLESGVTEEGCVLGFADTIDHPDIKLFRTAFLLARKEGSSLGSCLQRLARVTRQRQSFRRKVRSALAMQKLSAFGIALCAIVIGAVQWSSNPKVMLETLAHPVGVKVMLGGLALVGLGLAWMLSLTKSRI